MKQVIRGDSISQQETGNGIVEPTREHSVSIGEPGMHIGLEAHHLRLILQRRANNTKPRSMSMRIMDMVLGGAVGLNRKPW